MGNHPSFTTGIPAIHTPAMRQLSILLSVLISLSSTAQVVINEVNTSNMNGLADSFGEHEDWAELLNTTTAAVDLSGWYLSNKVSNPTKWAFPAGASIAANGRLMVFFSKRNTAAGAEFHTSFNLNQTEGDHVVLSDPSATIVDDAVLNPLTQLGHSLGRTTDGAATWSPFLVPTPNAPNSGASPTYAPKPQLSPGAGFYNGQVSISMSTSDGSSTIRYTLDGTEPTAASTAYTGPINLSATTVVRARCFSSTPGVPPSFLETNTYFVDATHTTAVLSVAGDQVDDLVNGNGSIDPWGSFEYFGPDQLLRDEATGQFNKHGNDSWAYDQRGFDYIARDQSGYNSAIHYPVFHASQRDKYQRLIIKGGANDNYPFEDGAHIRDAYVHSLAQAGHLKLDVRTYEPCVVYVNGQYWGVYEIREKVDDNDYTRGYYGQDKYDLQYLKTWGSTWSEYGGPQAQTDWDALRAYILGNNMGDPAAFGTVDGQFDWRSLVDYVVLNSYTVCTDWLNWNTGWWRGMNPNGQHKKWGYTLWDNDAVFGHYINYTGVPQTTPDADPCNAENLPDPGGQGHVPILQKLMDENPMVHDYYVNRYIDLGNTLFSCQVMLPYLDSLINLITPEMPGQVARWGGTMAEWQANVQQMRDFITARCTDIQQGMVDCYELEGPYNVVFKVEPPLSGSIQINSIQPGSYPFTGTYYGGIATTIQAISAEGWQFDHWETAQANVSPSPSDSVATVDLAAPDTVIAHFAPPIKYPVVLLTDPPGSAAIRYNLDLYTDFPATVERIPESIDTLTVFPGQYYSFKYWEFKYNTPNQNDTTMATIPVTIFFPDTIIAHLEQQDFVYFAPNAFTPNGDGINDTWRPINNVVELDSYSLRIFNRWGREVFSSTDPYEEWDGTADGKKMPLGVYVFQANLREAFTKDNHEIRGTVTVVP
ncbi:MAG TPA: CotH kinase family protein [Flavobacteriales bacterium]|nr:CotH kinase family protein [Flavobacteriales bacterium]